MVVLYVVCVSASCLPCRLERWLWGLMCLSVGLSVYVWFSSQWWHGVVRVDVSVCWFECVCVRFSSQWWRGVVRVDVSVCWFECVYDSVLSGDVGLWGLMCLSVGLSVCVIQFSVVTWGCEGWCVCLLVWVCVRFSSQWWRGVVRVDVSVCWFECV